MNSGKRSRSISSKTRILALKSVRFGGNISDILQEYGKDNEINYDLLLKQIQDPTLKSSQLVEWFEQCTSAAHMLDKKHKKIVDALLKVRWMEREAEVVAAFQSFVVALFSANSVHVRSVIKSLVSCFVPGFEKTISTKTIKQQNEQVYSTAHSILRTLFTLIPQSSSAITAVFSSSFPYMRKPGEILEWYVRNLLFVTTYAPHVRSSVLEIIIKKLTDIDVHATREDILNAEESDAGDAGQNLFQMDEDMETEEKLEMKHPLANRLDVLMHILLQYIHGVCYQNGELTLHESSKLFRELLVCFDKIILPVYELVHVQFIMFYTCSFEQSFLEKFVAHCWKKVVDPGVPCVIRKSSVCYLASLLSRASYASLNCVMTHLSDMVAWAHRYMRESVDSLFIDAYCCDILRHGTFYSVCQAILYVIIFRHKEILETDKGHNYLISLKLQHLLTSPLNPLRACLPSVVNIFSSTMRIHQIVYCETIIERNNRMVLPVAGISALSPTDFNPLETFFPFDPYVLKRSSVFIESLYKAWGGNSTESKSGGKDENDVASDYLMTESFNSWSNSLPKSHSNSLSTTCQIIAT